jgi:hypothetical protein
MKCPVCDDRWPADAIRCQCGYDFETRDPSVAIVRYRRDARNGNRLWWSGLFMLIGLPVAIGLLPGSPMGFLISVAQAGVAVTWIVQGLVRAERANKRLSAAKQLVQLPAARVVQR